MLCFSHCSLWNEFCIGQSHFVVKTYLNTKKYSLIPSKLLSDDTVFFYLVMVRHGWASCGLDCFWIFPIMLSSDANVVIRWSITAVIDLCKCLSIGKSSCPKLAPALPALFSNILDHGHDGVALCRDACVWFRKTTTRWLFSSISYVGLHYKHTAHCYMVSFRIFYL